MSREAGSGNQGDATSPKPKPTAVKANGSAPVIPWGDPGGATPSGSQRPGAVKSSPAAEAKSQAKPEQMRKSPEGDSSGAKDMAERDAHETGAKAKEGGKGKSAASSAVPQKGSEYSKKKSPSNVPASSKPESISGTSAPMVKDTNTKHEASQKAHELLKGRSPASARPVPSKPQSASLPLDAKENDSGRKDNVGDTQKKAQDTSKRKSPIVETKTPMKADSSHHPLERKENETEGKSSVVASVNQFVGSSKSPTGVRSASSAITDRNGKANVDTEASTPRVDQRSTEEKSPSDGRSVAPKPQSITGSESSAVVGSAAGNAQVTSKRKSPTDEKSIPSAKTYAIEGIPGRKTKDSEKKDPVTPSVAKAQDMAKMKSTDRDKSISSKSTALNEDKSAKKTDTSSKKSAGTSNHMAQDVATKIKAPDLEKVAPSKSAEVSKDLSQIDKDKKIHGTPKELNRVPEQTPTSAEKVAFPKDQKFVSEITDKSNKSSSTSSRTDKNIEKRSEIEKASSPSSNANGKIYETAKSKADVVDTGAKKSLSGVQPSKPAESPPKETEAETMNLEKPAVGPASKQISLSKSDNVVAKDKKTKTVTPVTQEATRDLGSSGLPKDIYVTSSEDQSAPESVNSPSALGTGCTLDQREDHSEGKSFNSKKVESEVVCGELSEKKDSKLHKTKVSDPKPSNGTGVVTTEHRQKPQNVMELNARSQGSLARERSMSVNGRKSATSSADPSKKGKNGESNGEGRTSVQRGNGGQAANPPSSSVVRMEGLHSPASSVTPNGSSSRTPTEHKTIVQKLQEARQEAILVRGTDRRDLRQQHSKSEMVLPAAIQTTIPVASGDTGDKQVTSSPNIKVQTPTTHAPAPAATITQCAPAVATGGRPKEMSRSEAVLPAAERTKEKQRTSSPNLSTHGAKQAGSTEGLPRNSGPGRNGHSEVPAREPSSRKGSVISDTAAEAVPGDGASRARSATWSQAVPQPSRRGRDEAGEEEDEESSTAPVSAASEDPEWDKRWSSAGSDVLAHKGPKASRAAPGAKAFGKEWRSEWGSETAWRGVAPAPGRVWESEAGLLGRHQRGPPPPGRLDLGPPGPLARKELVSPSSSSTASKGSGIERISEASSSYHSATSSTHGQRRDSVRADLQKDVAPVEETAALDEDSGDRMKLIEGAANGHHHHQMERKSGSGRRRGGHGNGSSIGSGNGGGVENIGADLEKVLQEEEEAAAGAGGEASGGADLAAGPEDQRTFIDIWDSEDKFSVSNSQLPLTPAGAEDDEGASIGSVATAEPERGNWTGRFDFLLSLLGYSVGLGNVWRFPYLCYNNGGGAFLIPFTIMLVIAGLPLMFMELSFGQFASLGPAAIYAKFCPLFHGLGFGMVIVSTVVMLYYNLIIAWTIFYMFASLNKQLPWQNCEPEWSTLDCYSYEIADKCAEENGTYYQRTCYNESEAIASNITQLAEGAEKRPPAEEYFNNYVLGLSKGIEETGEVRLSMALCLLLAWVIVFLCLSKGVQSSGKVVYFTALFPYVVLIILFIRGVTLPGASTGILFYLTPDWKRLSNAQVWGDAAVQIFFALSPAWGGLITLASYNKFSNNCYKDSLIVAVSNILTSFFAGFVIFSVIGFLAHELKVEVKKVVDQGAGLAFIVYPEVVTRLPVSPLWSLLFFVMLLTLGLDSQFALMETVTTAILDRFPNLREKKVWVVLVVAILGYFGGLIFTTNSGMYWLQLMDKYAANWSVLLIAISECILISWVYGAGRFLRDVQEMIGPQSRLWMFFWCWMWKLVTPATLLFILFFNWVEYAPASYGEYIYPLWADAVGWVIGVLPVVVIIIVGVVKVCTAPEGALQDKLRKLLQPTPDWGPSLKRSSAPPTYDSLRNTIVLMNGLPVIQETHVESQEDNTL